MKIVVLDGKTLNPGDLSWSELEKLGETKIYEETSKEDVIKNIGDAEILFVNKNQITREILEKTNVKWIGVLSTGYNGVDVKAAREFGIPVCNVPTYGNSAVAQFTIALLLEICSKVGEHNMLIQNGEWQRRGVFSFWNSQLIELLDKTMGIIGFGRNGKIVAEISKALGMKVVYYDKYVTSSENPDFKSVELDELLKVSDVVSLNCPLTDENFEIICEENIKKMKDGVIIVNTSRGQLINEADLSKYLNSGKIKGAGLDVVSSEPIEDNNPLLKAKNCIITPHIAWAPKESRERLLGIAANNLKEYLSGNLVNVVN